MPVFVNRKHYRIALILWNQREILRDFKLLSRIIWMTTGNERAFEEFKPEGTYGLLKFFTKQSLASEKAV